MDDEGRKRIITRSQPFFFSWNGCLYLLEPTPTTGQWEQWLERKKSSNILLSGQIRILIIREITEKAYDSPLAQFLIGLGKICNAQIEPSTSKSALPKLEDSSHSTCMTNSTSEFVGLQLCLPVTFSFIISWYNTPYILATRQKNALNPQLLQTAAQAFSYISDQMNMHRDTTGYQNPPSHKMTVHTWNSHLDVAKPQKSAPGSYILLFLKSHQTNR